MNEAAYSLRALGRQTEALEPTRAGLAMRVKQKAWANAARDALNLSELELTMGGVAGAVRNAEQSVTYADRSGNEGLQIVMRTTHANALHEAGRRAEAEALFREAEGMQAEHQPSHPLLYSVRGFYYCDLLLTEAERVAWRTLLATGRGEEANAEDRSTAATSVASCRAISERAAQTLKWVTTQNWLLDIALDRLTLGRAAHYGAVLESTEERRGLTSAATELDAAADGLRGSGYQNHIPGGLLTRAWCSCVAATRHRLLNRQKQAVEGETSAQRNLDDAWEIAERGPIPLLLADIHLYRARLFHAATPYPWAADLDGHARGPLDDLAEARRLIEKHGYWRRKDELEDAEAAARDWPRSIT